MNAPRSLTDRRPLALARELWRRYNDDQCWSWAAALSFFGLLSVVPLLLCGIAALGLVIHDAHDAAERVFSLLKASLPGKDAGAMAQRLVIDARVEEQAAALLRIRGWAAVVGGISLVWTASRVFINAMPPMNAAFRAPETRGFLRMQADAVALLLGTGLLGGLSLLIGYLPDLLHWTPPTPWWVTALFFVLSVAINALLFTLIYRFLPSPAAKVTWSASAVAGVVTAVLWEMVRQGFSLYLRRFGGASAYDRLYGSLGGVFLMFLWVYYSSALLLLGAEIAGIWSDARARPQSVTEAG